jgi:hypothetical protein
MASGSSPGAPSRRSARDQVGRHIAIAVMVIYGLSAHYGEQTA